MMTSEEMLETARVCVSGEARELMIQRIAAELNRVRQEAIAEAAEECAEIAALQKKLGVQQDVIANYAKADDAEQSEYDRLKERVAELENQLSNAVRQMNGAMGDLIEARTTRDAAQAEVAAFAGERETWVQNVLLATTEAAKLEAAFTESAAQSERFRQSLVAAQEQVRLHAEEWGRERTRVRVAVMQLRNVMSGAGPTSAGVTLLYKDRDEIGRLLDGLSALAESLDDPQVDYTFGEAPKP